MREGFTSLSPLLLSSFSTIQNSTLISIFFDIEEVMKISWQGFLHEHSWGIVGQNISRSLKQQGHDVNMFATAGIKNFPQDLASNLFGYVEEGKNILNGKDLDKEYDMQLSYTAMRNFQQYFRRGTKNRFAIWCYEWPILPVGFAKHHQFVDSILAPSEFAKYCFVNSKVPESKVLVVPHGINPIEFEHKEKYPLKTKKSIKIFVPIHQAHKRKNIRGIFQAYHMAFTDADDVCLVAKITKNKLKSPFEVDPVKIYNDVKTKFKNPPAVELITEYIPNIIELYNACDIVFGMGHCEGFSLPALETIAAGKINICPRYGGQLDFLNDHNSLLISGKTTQAPIDEQYWEGNKNNTHFEPDLNDAVDKLRYVYNNLNTLNKKFLPTYQQTINDYNWNKVSARILSLTK